MPSTEVVFSPSVDERQLDRETDTVDERLHEVGQDVPVTFDAEEMDSLTPAGASGGGAGAAGGGGPGTPVPVGGLSRIPKPVAGVTAAAAVPVALAGGGFLALKSINDGLSKVSPALQQTNTMFETAIQQFRAPFGAALAEQLRPSAESLLEAGVEFRQAAREQGFDQAFGQLTQDFFMPRLAELSDPIRDQTDVLEDVRAAGEAGAVAGGIFGGKLGSQLGGAFGATLATVLASSPLANAARELANVFSGTEKIKWGQWIPEVKWEKLWPDIDLSDMLDLWPEVDFPDMMGVWPEVGFTDLMNVWPEIQVPNLMSVWPNIRFPNMMGLWPEVRFSDFMGLWPEVQLPNLMSIWPNIRFPNMMNIWPEIRFPDLMGIWPDNIRVPDILGESGLDLPEIKLPDLRKWLTGDSGGGDDGEDGRGGNGNTGGTGGGASGTVTIGNWTAGPIYTIIGSVVGGTFPVTNLAGDSLDTAVSSWDVSSAIAVDADVIAMPNYIQSVSVTNWPDFTTSEKDDDDGGVDDGNENEGRDPDDAGPIQRGDDEGRGRVDLPGGGTGGLVPALSASPGSRASGDSRRVESKLDNVEKEVRRLRDALDMEITVGEETIARVVGKGQKNRIDDTDPLS